MTLEIYLYSVLWFLVGGLSFVILDKYEPTKTRGSYILTLILCSVLAPVGLIALIITLFEKSEWLNEEI